MEQQRTDRIQLALWGGAGGFMVMAVRAGLAAPVDEKEVLAWIGAAIVVGAGGLCYSLRAYFRRPRPQ